jgi:hypothetical protein
MDDPDLLTEVPDVLKKLARVVTRAFYTHVDVVIVDALVHHTWYVPDAADKDEDIPYLRMWVWNSEANCIFCS